ncbi:MAG: guanitoxin biosynthesis pre-guanitoxin forming N-methyltransferase GntF [Candidatus Binatia bacterium]
MDTSSLSPSLLESPHTIALPPTSDWRGFDPRAYLHEYYADLGEENLAILRFYVDVFRQLPQQRIVLDVGSGPTIYSLISAATKAGEIHIAEYLEANRVEIRKWLSGDNTAFNWRPFIAQSLWFEQTGPCSAFDIRRREAAIRNRVTYITRCDLRQVPSFLGGRQTYDVVMSNFCAESITDDFEEWRFFVANLASLVNVGGTFVMTALKNATCYAVGPMLFPAVSIAEIHVMQRLLELGFSRENIVIRSVPADRPSRHYEGLMLVAAVK